MHRHRAAADAIIVGTGTALFDDPALTARIDGELTEHQPVPVVIGARALPRRAKLHDHPHEPIFYGTRDLQSVLTDLRDRGLHRVFVEGGPALASAFLEAGLADRLLAYVAPVILGGDRLSVTDIGVGTIGDARRLRIDSVTALGDDILFDARFRERRAWPDSSAAPAAHTAPRGRTLMFTGIIEELGEVAQIAPHGDGVRLSVRAPKAVSDAGHGDSISISGVCLTVVAHNEHGFTADVMRQTLDMSTLGGLRPGARVNVERAMTAGGRLGGHIVQGHIDGTGHVLNVTPGGQWSVIRIGLPARFAPLVVDKGSIAVDGVSLTVSAVAALEALVRVVRSLAHPEGAAGDDPR